MNNSILNSPDVLAALQQRKHALSKKLKASRTKMMEGVSSFTGGPIPKTTSRLQGLSRLAVNAFFVYRGFRFCTDILYSIRSIFSPRKRRR
jgi:hypothetical protein